MAQASPVPHKGGSPPRKRAQPKISYVFNDSTNAAGVLRLLYSMGLYNMTQIANQVGISVSAVSEWLREPNPRPIPPRRWPELARVWGLPEDGRTFATPVDVVEQQMKPHLEAAERNRRIEIQKALDALANMDRYTKSPVQSRLFEPGSSSEARRGHLQAVSVNP